MASTFLQGLYWPPYVPHVFLIHLHSFWIQQQQEYGKDNLIKINCNPGRLVS
jgi:hypothetical protein